MQSKRCSSSHSAEVDKKEGCAGYVRRVTRDEIADAVG